MKSSEEKLSRIRNKNQSEKRKKNAKLKFNQIVFNFYIPTETEDVSQKVRCVNISIVDEKKTSKNTF